MDKLLDLQIGWFNKERLILLLGILAILVGFFMFLTSGRTPHELMKTVHYKKHAEFDTQPLAAFDSTALASISWSAKSGVFVLLDAPQLEIDPPTPPSINTGLVPPPPFPQSSSKGGSRTGGEE